MIVLYILLGLLALVLLLLLQPIRLCLQLDESGSLRIHASLSFVALFRQPAKEKPFRLRRYSQRALNRREKKQVKKQARQAKKQAKKAAKRPPTKTPSQPPTLRQRITKLTDTLSLVTSLIDTLHERLFRATHIHVHRLSVRVGSDDAAKTALLYGAICPSVALLFGVLQEKSNLHLHHPETIRVIPDFTHEGFSAELDIRIHMRVWHAVSLGLRSLVHIITHKARKRSPQTTARSPQPQP